MATFYSRQYPSLTVGIPPKEKGGDPAFVRFEGGRYETRDAHEAKVLRKHIRNDEYGLSEDPDGAEDLEVGPVPSLDGEALRQPGTPVTVRDSDEDPLAPAGDDPARENDPSRGEDPDAAKTERGAQATRPRSRSSRSK